MDNEIYADSSVMGNLDDELKAGVNRVNNLIQTLEEQVNNAEIDGPTKDAILANVARKKQFLDENKEFVSTTSDSAGEMKVATDNLVANLEDLWS